MFACVGTHASVSFSRELRHNLHDHSTNAVILTHEVLVCQYWQNYSAVKS